MVPPSTMGVNVEASLPVGKPWGLSQGSSNFSRAQGLGSSPTIRRAKEQQKLQEQPLNLRSCSWNQAPATHTPERVWEGDRLWDTKNNALANKEHDHSQIM